MQEFKVPFDYDNATEEERKAFFIWSAEHQVLDEEEQWIDDHIEEIFPNLFSAKNAQPLKAAAE